MKTSQNILAFHKPSLKHCCHPIANFHWIMISSYYITAKYSKKSKRFHGYIKILVPVLVSAAFFVLFALAYWRVMKRKKGNSTKIKIRYVLIILVG